MPGVRVSPLGPNHDNLNLFPIGDGFGLLVFFERFENTYFRNGVKKPPTFKPRGPRKKKQTISHKVTRTGALYSRCARSLMVYSFLRFCCPASRCTFHSVNSRRSSSLSQKARMSGIMHRAIASICGNCNGCRSC